MSIKVIENYHTTVRCNICLEDYFIPSFAPSTPLQTTRTKTKATNNIPTLYRLDGCYHPICQPCLEQYTTNTLEERSKKGSSTITNSDRMKFINCPVIGCNQSYSVNGIITKVFPFRHRLAIWWRQSVDNKNGFLDFLQKLKNKRDSPSSSSSTTTAGGSGSQKHVSREFLELALKEGWIRCPKCKFFVERREGCRHITCRCGIQFCYLCGTQFCKKNSCYKNRDNLHAELQFML